MIELQDHQFELDDVPFGIYTDVTLENGGFDPGTTSWRTQDSDNSMEDGTSFGVDFTSGPTWGFSLSTDMEDTETALAAMARLRKAWKGEPVRSTPRAVMPLRYAIAGRTRRVYGRPRRWSAPPDNMILSGYIPITADFQCADDLHYDDVESSSGLISIVPSSTGGLLSPLIGPLTTTLASAPRAGRIDVGGDTATWARMIFRGPVTDPWVEVAGWRVQLNMTLAYDDVITLDSRPWARTVLRNGSGSVAGRLSRTSRLAKMKLAPGAHEVVFGGSDQTGTASVEVLWRSAYESL